MKTQEIIQAALQLPLKERQIIAETVVQSLTTDSEFSDEQLSLIDERLQALNNGTATLLDSEAVFEQLRHQFQR